MNEREVDCINQQWVEHSKYGFEQHQLTLILIFCREAIIKAPTEFDGMKEI